jgi:hypothetical protein
VRSLVIIFLLFLISCSTTTKTSEPIVAVPSDVTVAEEAPVIVEDQSAESTTIEIPGPSTAKKPVIALIFGPGLNRAAGYSAFLKALKKQDISAQMVSGSGMGAVIAAHYAAGETPQKIEWLFFKFFNETRGKKPFSRSWQKSLEEVFLKGFQNTQIQDLKIPLVIPVFQKNPPMIKNFSQGSVFQLLKAQFSFSFKGKEQFISPLEKQVFNAVWMRNLGAEIVIGVDALGKKLLFEEEDPFLRDQYLKISKIIKKDQRYLDLFFTLPFSEMPLDSDKKLPESLQKTSEYGKWAASIIKSKRDLRKNHEDED